MKMLTTWVQRKCRKMNSCLLHLFIFLSSLSERFVPMFPKTFFVPLLPKIFCLCSRSLAEIGLIPMFPNTPGRSSFSFGGTTPRGGGNPMWKGRGCWLFSDFWVCGWNAKSVTIQMKGTELQFPAVLFMLDKVVLTFESVDEILKYGH